jgi:hypothetical protein
LWAQDGFYGRKYILDSEKIKEILKHEPGVYAAGSLSLGDGLAGYFLGLFAKVHARAERLGIF